MSDNKKTIAIDQVVIDIEQKFGKGSIATMDGVPKVFDAFGSGFGSIDVALGGGYPKGRIIEIYGPEESGKTTLALHAIREVQRAGGAAAFIDAEHALELDYAKSIGIDFGKLLVSQPDNGEQALEICEALTRCGAADLIVIDSVSELIPKDEIDGEPSDPYTSNAARMFSKALRTLAGISQRSMSSLMFINHLRQSKDRMSTGGNALKFYASVRVDVRVVDRIRSNGLSVGFRSQARITKNKMSPPFKSAMFDIMRYPRCSCGRDLPNKLDEGYDTFMCLCGTIWKPIMKCAHGCKGTTCHCQSCGATGVQLNEDGYCEECDTVECRRCGSQMSSAEDAECMSEKCVAFRKFADEHANDPED